MKRNLIRSGPASLILLPDLGTLILAVLGLALARQRGLPALGQPD